ncbi:hypothetical protein QTG54_000048 [Skeletonema marinoi]|uniref:Enoyl reductase (ER) domain-containing protein n=1 Tax=Skeletonema marinoi TaxID=267567 RepID=A0AAD9DJ67_9STRA|nr:hypothetical protein QTG54_000048 [Skeletonema marinoi]
MSEQEELAVLIYKSSKTAKARAAAAAAMAAAKETEKQMNAPSEAHQTTSTRKRSSANLSGNNTSAKSSKRMSPSKRERRPLLAEHEVGTHVPKKDARKRRRYECSADGCTKNNVINRGVCVKHGAKIKRCISDGCTNNAQKGGVCKRHGAKVKRCSMEGCTNIARKGGVCIRHGAQQKRCSSEGCTNNAQQRGVCKRHGAKVKQCISEGCTNQALKGGVCIKHGATSTRKTCSSEGCANIVVSLGVCIRHGAKVKQCISEGCANNAQKGGVCRRHGASRTLHDETTAFGSEFEKTTATLTTPNQNNPAASDERKSSGVPEEFCLCSVPNDAHSSILLHAYIIKVKSAAINPVDYKLPRFIGGKGVGFDVSGVVERVCPIDATDFSVGDNVFGRVRTGLSSGSLADYAIVSTDRIAKKPEWLSFDEAAAIGVAYLTGVHAFKLGNVKEGASVLVIGASGGCGLAGIQLAVAMKANVVGICSGKNFDFVQGESGIDQMENVNLELAMSEFKEKNVGKFDCIYDTATGSGHGENYVSSMAKLLRDETGEYVQINGGMATIMRYYTHPQHNFFLTSDENNQTDLVEITRLLKSTGVKPHIDLLKPFDAKSVAEGFEHLKGRRTKGKISNPGASDERSNDIPKEAVISQEIEEAYE